MFGRPNGRPSGEKTLSPQNPWSTYKSRKNPWSMDQWFKGTLGPYFTLVTTVVCSDFQNQIDCEFKL